MSPQSQIVAILLALAFAGPALAADPPKQPAKGPGGADYTVAAEDVLKRRYGKGNEEVFVFRPTTGGQAKRPVVVFLHAYGAMSPRHYGNWIEHLVRKGHIVIYPRMQATNSVPRADLTKHAAAGVKAALDALERDAKGVADLERVAYAGHSSGGIVAANLAAGAAGFGLPPARLVFAATPGNSWGSPRLKTPLASLATIPASALVVTMTAQGDNIARETDARTLIREASAVPTANKMLVKTFTDDHGRPVLLANHNAAASLNEAYEGSKIVSGDPVVPVQPEVLPARGQRGRQPVRGPAPPIQPERNDNEPDFGGGATNALDYFAFWKILDLALDAAFAGKDTTPIKTFPGLADMGVWSDGWPVKRLTFESARETSAEPPTPVAQPARPGVRPQVR